VLYFVSARVALPIFEPILQAVWAQSIAPKAAQRAVARGQALISSRRRI
jgi:hypothetical protein